MTFQIKDSFNQKEENVIKNKKFIIHWTDSIIQYKDSLIQSNETIIHFYKNDNSKKL